METNRRAVYTLVEIDHAALVGTVDGGDHLLDLLLARLEAQRAQHHLERVGVDDALALGVEEIERLPNLAALLLGERERDRLLGL